MSSGLYISAPSRDLTTMDAEIRVVEELREVLPRSGFRKQPPDFLEDESGQQVANPIKVRRAT